VCVCVCVCARVRAHVGGGEGSNISWSKVLKQHLKFKANSELEDDLCNGQPVMLWNKENVRRDQEDVYCDSRQTI
jgi:hypothetical protein